MKKIAAGDPAFRAPDLIAGNLEQIEALVAVAFTEGRIDFEVISHVRSL